MTSIPSDQEIIEPAGLNPTNSIITASALVSYPEPAIVVPSAWVLYPVRAIAKTAAESASVFELASAPAQCRSEVPLD